MKWTSKGIGLIAWWISFPPKKSDVSWSNMVYFPIRDGHPSFMHSFICSFAFVHSFIHSFLPSLLPPSLPSFLPFPSLALPSLPFPSLLPSFPSFIRSFVPSFISFHVRFIFISFLFMSFSFHFHFIFISFHFHFIFISFLFHFISLHFSFSFYFIFISFSFLFISFHFIPIPFHSVPFHSIPFLHSFPFSISFISIIFLFLLPLLFFLHNHDLWESSPHSLVRFLHLTRCRNPINHHKGNMTFCQVSTNWGKPIHDGGVTMNHIVAYALSLYIYIIKYIPWKPHWTLLNHSETTIKSALAMVNSYHTTLQSWE